MVFQKFRQSLVRYCLYYLSMVWSKLIIGIIIGYLDNNQSNIVLVNFCFMLVFMKYLYSQVQLYLQDGQDGIYLLYLFIIYLVIRIIFNICVFFSIEFKLKRKQVKQFENYCFDFIMIVWFVINYIFLGKILSL